MTVEKTKENVHLCQCMKCPSYTTFCKIKNITGNAMDMINGIENAEHFEGLYCAFGKSYCMTEIKTCLCATCPITSKCHLTGGAYCIKGAAK